MSDLQLMYRECGAETRDDYLRELANENGLPIACVRKIADRLGESEDFGTIYQLADGRWTTERPRSRDDERERVFWKLDYYDRDMQFASEDAANPAVTRRVLTLMLSDEY